MKYVCVRKCNIAIDGARKQLYKPGNVVDTKKCPSHFEPLNGPVQFGTSTEDVLLNSEWTFEDAEAFIKDAYDIELERKSKPEVVTQIIDARERFVADPELPPKAE